MDSAGKEKSQNRRTGRLVLQPVLQLPTGQSVQLLADPGAHGTDQVGAKHNERNGANDEGSGHGMAKVAGKQSRQNRAAAGEHSRRTIRPAQAL